MFGIIIILIILCCFFITPKTINIKHEYHSSQLQTTNHCNGDLEIIEFINEDGNNVIAADKGYAKCVVRSKDNKKIYTFYDDKDLQVSRYPGYYAILREYDDKGNNIYISYLDIQEKPCITAYGYAIEKREYNDKRQITKIRYYDTCGYPITTASFGNGINNIYNIEGNSCKSTFVNESEMPILTTQGYASVERRFYGSDELGNKAESEYYFDEKGNPVALSLGQFGVLKEYGKNGLESVVTYLDSDGKPMVNNKGYVTVKKTYHADDTIETEQYFDLKGYPVSLSEGQYGIYKEDNQLVFLNQNGEKIFNLKRLLYNHTWLVIPGAICIIILSTMVEKKWNYLLLYLYCILIVYMTLLFRDSNTTTKVVLLHRYKNIFSDSEARIEILQNIWLFIPLGAILYKLNHRKGILLVPIFLSIIIEAIQYFTKTGFCSIDDVISNGLGGVIGFVIESMLNWKNINKYSEGV